MRPQVLDILICGANLEPQIIFQDITNCDTTTKHCKVSYFSIN